MIGAVIAYLWLAAITACLLIAIWSSDLRWFGTSIILVMMFVLPTILNNVTKDKE